VIGTIPEELMIESFFLPDFKVDFFLSDFCLLGLVPLSNGVFVFSILMPLFSSFEVSCDFLVFLGLLSGLFLSFFGLTVGLFLLLLDNFSSFS